MTVDTVIGQANQLAVNSVVSNEQVLERIFGASEPLTAVREALKNLDHICSADDLELMRGLLGSLATFFLGCYAIEDAKFVDARDSLHSAAEEFDTRGIEDLRDLAVGLELYSVGVIALQEMNIGHARYCLDQTRIHLQKAGKFAGRFETLIDHIEPEALFLHAAQEIAQFNLDTARLIVQQASSTAEKVAATYYDVDSEGHAFWLGYASFFKAYYNCIRVLAELNQFGYQKLASEVDLMGDAVRARNFWTKADKTNEVRRRLVHVNLGIIELLEHWSQMIAVMPAIFRATFKANRKFFDAQREKTRKAYDAFVLAGPFAAIFLRICDQCVNKINNLEQLTRPLPRDQSRSRRRQRQ